MNISTYCRKIKQLYDNGEYVQLLLILLTGGGIILLSSVLVISITFKVIGFIVEQIEIIAIVGGILVSIYGKMKVDTKARKELEEIEKAEIERSEQLLEKAFCESNYILAREIIYLTLSDCADVIKLVKPTRLSELDLPERNIQKNSYSMSQFIVLKNADIDANEIREILQMRLTQKLNALDFTGVTQRCHICDGNVYPLLMIDDVHDFGKYVHIDVIWVNDRYCKLINARMRARLENLNRKENEIVDGDF